MMYLIGFIALLVTASTLALRLKIKALTRENESLKAEKKKADIQLDISQRLLKTREKVKQSQDEIDKVTDGIDDKIPESGEELSNEEKNTVDDITARLTD